MYSDGMGGETHLFSYLGIGKIVGDQQGNLALAGGEGTPNLFDLFLGILALQVGPDQVARIRAGGCIDIDSVRVKGVDKIAVQGYEQESEEQEGIQEFKIQYLDHGLLEDDWRDAPK